MEKVYQREKFFVAFITRHEPEVAGSKEGLKQCCLCGARVTQGRIKENTQQKKVQKCIHLRFPFVTDLKLWRLLFCFSPLVLHQKTQLCGQTWAKCNPIRFFSLKVSMASCPRACNGHDWSTFNYLHANYRKFC